MALAYWKGGMAVKRLVSFYFDLCYQTITGMIEVGLREEEKGKTNKQNKTKSYVVFSKLNSKCMLCGCFLWSLDMYRRYFC